MALASRLLRWFGGTRVASPVSTISGCVDELGNGHVRGWVRDSSRPEALLSVELCADGEPIARFRADKVRDDLANLFGDDGRNGFSGFFELHAWRGRGHLLSVRVADRPDVSIGSVPGPIDRLAGFPPEKWSCLINGLATH